MPDLTQPSPNNKPASVSGKRMTVVVVLTLLITGALFYWVTKAYGTYNAARRETDRTWRELASELDSRYRALNESIIQASEAGQIEPEIAQPWASARDKFSATSQSLRQIEAAQKLEQVVSSLPEAISESHPWSAQLEMLANKYSAAAANQKAVGRMAGSRLLKLMLRLPEPAEFQLAK